MATAVRELKQNPDIAIPMIQKFLSVKDIENVRAAYQSYVKAYPDKLEISVTGLQEVLDKLGRKDARAKAIKAGQIVDAGTLQALEREGFFARLTGPRS